jgi:hypothetical protein
MMIVQCHGKMRCLFDLSVCPKTGAKLFRLGYYDQTNDWHRAFVQNLTAIGVDLASGTEEAGEVIQPSRVSRVSRTMGSVLVEQQAPVVSTRPLMAYADNVCCSVHPNTDLLSFSIAESSRARD